MEFSDSDISNFLTELIELGGSNEVDRNSEKFIRLVNKDGTTGDVCEIPSGNRTKKLAIYGSQAKDAVIVNPFADGELGDQNNWFYRTRNMLIGGLVAKLILHILETASVDNKDTENTNGSELIKYIGKYAACIDDKMVTEFKKIAKIDKDNDGNKLDEFMKLYYNKRKKICSVRCCLFDESTKGSYVGIRKSTWEPLQQIVLKLLNTSDLKTFNETSSSSAIPTFESFVRVFLNVFDALKDPLKLIDIYVDTTAIRAHLPRLELYYNKAKWCTSCTNFQPKQTSSSSVMPWDYKPVPQSPLTSVQPLSMNSVPANPFASSAPANPFATNFGGNGIMDSLDTPQNKSNITSGNPFVDML